MLKHLYIKNYALIDTLDIDLVSGFSVITGETGAGKSIILGALGLILGQRADMKSVKTDAQKCTIEATFDLTRYDLSSWFDDNDLEYDQNNCIMRRELTATGKTRSFINDTPVTLAQMRELGEKLIDIHSQHQNLLLQKENFQLNILDIIAHNSDLLYSYQETFRSLQNARKELAELEEQIAQSKTNEEFMRFQLNELTNAELKEGEQQELEEELEVVSHTEDIKSALYDTNGWMTDDEQGIITKLHQATQRLNGIISVYPKMQQIAERLDSALIEIKDIASETDNALNTIYFDPERLTYINDRLNRLYSLEKKYSKNSIQELIQERDALQQKINNIENIDDILAEKQAEVEKLLKATQDIADNLSDSRKGIVPTVEQEIISRLISLGIPNAVFSISVDKEDLAPSGQDKVSFLFSANKGMALRPVSQVASGGEIARLMLALKALISSAVKLPTIIFDEIDTGVSGRIAEQMAAIMQEMGNHGRQVISITHLPQIAAAGRCHYKVEKHDTDNATTSVLRQLNEDERTDEIAQMLSGSDITEAARTNAKELLRTNLTTQQKS